VAASDAEKAEGTLDGGGLARPGGERPGRRLRRLACGLAVAAAVLLAAGCSGSSAPSAGTGTAGSAGAGTAGLSPGGHQYESFTSYPGWTQASIPPGKFNFAPYTVISDFGLDPTLAGGICVCDLDSLSNITAVVAAAHKAGKTVIMAIGEVNEGNYFASAAGPRYRAAFIRNIVSFVSRYGFDGVDVDWEEQVPQNQAHYIALVKGLRSALNAAFPGKTMYLSADVDVGEIPPDIAAQVAPYVNSLNMETFQDNGVSSAVSYTRAGIPASKLLLGIGVASNYYDTTEARVAAKVKYVEDHGLKGTLLWQPGYLNTYRTDPRLNPLLAMLSSSG
jgi:hypothetical protein